MKYLINKFFLDYEDGFEIDSEINIKSKIVNSEISDISINHTKASSSSSTSIFSNSIVRVESPSKDCEVMSSTTLITSVAPPSLQQQQLPVAVVIATAAPPPSSSTSSLLPLLQSCGESSTILSSSATTSSTTSVHHMNNNVGNGGTENDQLLGSDSSLTNGTLTPNTSSSLTVAQTLNLLINSNNGSTSSTPTSVTASDEFVRKLIEAVRKQPCLYNSNHEHYGNKHSSAQYRTIVWQNLCKELDYPGIFFI